MTAELQGEERMKVVVSESARERETYRFLHLDSVYATVDASKPPYPPAHLCSDSSLTAFAQLGALRLNARRGLISLFDKRLEYFIAEASRSLSLRQDSRHAEKDGLLLCGLAVSRRSGVSENVLAPPKTMVAPENTSAQKSDLPVYVVPDLAADGLFKTSQFVLNHLNTRFYAAVPIRTSSGANIGVYCVLDDEPRAGLDPDSAQFMRDMSMTVMDHLDMSRCKRELSRGYRMVRGLGSYVEGMTTMHSLQKNIDPVLYHPPDEEGLLNQRQQEIARDMDSHDPMPLSLQHAQQNLNFVRHPPFDGQDRQGSGIKPNMRQKSALAQAGPEESVPKMSVFSKSSTPSLTSGSAKATLFPDPAEPGVASDISLKSSASSSADLHEDAVRLSFSRAANVIRESIQVESVLFFDVSVRSFGGLLKGGTSDSSDENENSSSYSSASEGSRISTGSGAEASRACAVLGFSTSESSSIDGEVASQNQMSVPERFLRVLLRRYPHGKIFNFDESGMQSSDTEPEVALAQANTNLPAQQSAKIRRSKPYSRSSEAQQMIKICPGARSVALFPLWDSHRERWFAGGVAWTRTPTRVFTVRGEMSFLTAFGNVVMAEIAKIDAHTSNQAKSDVLGSISHELRSPLHGILGGVEILQNTEMDVFQSSIVHTLETCGITLLDTIDHLLDYAKINNFSRKSARQRRGERPGSALTGSDDRNNPKSGMMSIASDVELDVLAEEVIESIYAGHVFQMAVAANRGSQDTSARPTLATFGSSDRIPSTIDYMDYGNASEPVPKAQAVTIILDIQPATSSEWLYHSHPGGLRRIFMNIFGNALKYTSRGSILVSLRQKSHSSKNSSRQSDVVLTVKDTGKGIGQEFLNSNLFTPFSQENSLSPGIGLGLSITRQITASLNGRIDVQSTVGVGSTISITLPMIRPESFSAKLESSAGGEFDKQISRMAGMRLALLGFDSDVESPSIAKASSVDEWTLPRATVETLCRDWLRMHLLPQNEPPTTVPDLILATEAGAKVLIANNQVGEILQPVVVICNSAAAARDFRSNVKTVDSNGVFEFISQPCGPRKFAKAFTLCLDRWSRIHLTDVLPLERSEYALSSSAATAKQVHHFSSSSPLILQSRDPPSEAVQLGQPTPHISPKSSFTNMSTISSPSSGLSSSATGIPEKETAYLLVDDNAINLQLLVAYMKSKNYRYTTAADGLQALNAYKAANGEYGCILMDISMPIMDGLEATRHIREFEQRQSLGHSIIIALTGLASEASQKEAFASGIDLFLTKPVRLKELGRILQRRPRGSFSIDAS